MDEYGIYDMYDIYIYICVCVCAKPYCRHIEKMIIMSPPACPVDMVPCYVYLSLCVCPYLIIFILHPLAPDCLVFFVKARWVVKDLLGFFFPTLGNA